MRKLGYILLLLPIVFSTCKDRCKRLDGPRERYEQLLTRVESFELETPAEVVIYKDTLSQNNLEIYAQPEVYHVLNSDVINRQCQINMDACFKDQQAILINATFSSIKHLYFGSAGEVTSGAMIEEDTISIENTGLGDIDLTIKNKQITSHITSSGSVLLSGISNRSVCLSSGSGEFSAYNLIADTVVVHSIGSSVIEVYADKYLEVNFLNPTTLKYRGNPETITVIGEGTVVDDNL